MAITGSRCVYMNCDNTRYKCAGMTFFKIPVKDKTRCAEWLLHLGNSRLMQLTPAELMAKEVCENHFRGSAFRDRHASKRKLLPNAVPIKYIARTAEQAITPAKVHVIDDPNDSGSSNEILSKRKVVGRRQASKEALKQMQRYVSSINEDPDTFEILSEDEDVSLADLHSRKKYKVSHRKSSDGNDRDVLVLRTINWGEKSLNLDAWVEELSPAQIEMRKKSQVEYDDLNEKLAKYLADNNCEVIHETDFSTAYEVDQQCAVYTTNEPPSATITNNANSGPAAAQPSAETQGSNALLLGGNKNRKRGRPPSSATSLPAKVAKVASNSTNPVKPSEATALGGLSTGRKNDSPAPGASVVDLTEDEINNAAQATKSNATPVKHAADSREISFNKLQGKTFPSLVVVARPYLRLKESASGDRGILDSKVKGVLMHPPTKFTEWLIQQGLIKSDQNCIAHTSNKLKLGMYGDVSKFPLSGGYVWISECCPTRFVSVFSGSLFENSMHPPSVILKLIYHWCCQTNVQNVIQWVKVDNLFVKSLYTLLRSVCTVAIHTHLDLLGGAGKRVEIGVISLGTTSQDGAQRQVKVEVLGVLETDTKKIRLRAIEPHSDGNFKKRFAKILEPLVEWVDTQSILVTDLTVDRNTLTNLGFINVQQPAASALNSNQMIMDYLRRIVPRMFQNTLSLLSRPIIQQFLDELVWREWCGLSPGQAFNSIVQHISFQTHVETGQSMNLRLNKVSLNPFRNWSLKPGKKSINHILAMNRAEMAEKRPVRVRKQVVRSLSPQTDSAPPPPPPPTLKSSKQQVVKDIELPEQTVSLESYYFGTITGRSTPECGPINMKCVMCKIVLCNNLKIMKHLFQHAKQGGGEQQCRYCLVCFDTDELLKKHISSSHPKTIKKGNTYICVICEQQFNTTYALGKHMSLEHVPAELPYLCATCGYRCSNHRQAVDHFYSSHNNSNTIQCPFCLKSTTIASGTRMITQNLNFFLQHLQKHHKKTFAKKCSRCVLWFVQKEILKDHAKLHVSQRRKAGLTPWRHFSNITVPMSINEEPITDVDVNVSKLQIKVDPTLRCLECNDHLTTSRHFPSVINCKNQHCQYVTCCQKAIDSHAKKCNTIGTNLPQCLLPHTMHCVCGYTSNDGNQMAKHLYACERKSAYPSAEAAKAATVTHNMLDVLGLVRRSEEGSVAASANLTGAQASIPTTSTSTEPSDVMEILSDEEEATNAASLDEKLTTHIKDDITVDETPQTDEAIVMDVDPDVPDLAESTPIEAINLDGDNTDNVDEATAAEEETNHEMEHSIEHANDITDLIDTNTDTDTLENIQDYTNILGKNVAEVLNTASQDTEIMDTEKGDSEIADTVDGDNEIDENPTPDQDVEDGNTVEKDKLNEDPADATEDAIADIVESRTDVDEVSGNVLDDSNKVLNNPDDLENESINLAEDSTDLVETSVPDGDADPPVHTEQLETVADPKDTIEETSSVEAVANNEDMQEGGILTEDLTENSTKEDNSTETDG